MENKVKELVAQVMEVSLQSVQDDSSPETITSWDSFRHMTLILALEQSFGVTFSDEQIMGLTSVKAICSMLKTLM